MMNRNKYWLALLLFATGYFLSVRFGLMFTTATQVSPVWPATAVGLLIPLIFGMQFWPAIALGALAANVVTGGPVLTIAGITIANTFEAVVGAWLIITLRRKLSHSLGHPEFLALAIAIFIASALGATIGVLALTFGGVIPWAVFGSAWVTWFAGDFTGGIILLPVFNWLFTNAKIERPEFVKLASLATIGAALLWFVLMCSEGAPFLLLIFPYLLLSVAGAGCWGLNTATILIYLFTIASTQKLGGLFYYTQTTSNLTGLQVILLATGFSTLILTDLAKTTRETFQSSARILLCCWVLVAAGFFVIFNLNKEKTNIQFKAIVNSIGLKLRDHADLYFSVLRSGEGLFATHQSIQRENWKVFVDHLKPEENLPGLRALGASFRVTASGLDSFSEKMRSQGLTDFSYHVVPNGNLVAMSEHYVVSYMEPIERNRPAIGLDLATEAVRKSGADLARDTGDVTITDRMTLVQDTRQRAGFLIYKAIYSHGAIPTTTAERRLRLIGWVHESVVSEDFFSASLSGPEFKNLSYSVSQGHKFERVIEKEDFKNIPEQAVQALTIKLANQDFHLRIKPSASFKLDIEILPFWAGLAGLVISLLLAALVASLESVKQRALELARETTAGLKISEEKWRRLFEILPVGVSIVGATGEIVDENPALGKILDFPKNGGGKRSRHFIHEDGTPFLKEDFPSHQAMAKKHAIPPTVVGIIKENGATVWMSVSAVPLVSDGLSCVVVTVDQTREYERTRVLAESELQLKEAQSVAQLASWNFDVQTGIGSCSEGMQKIFPIKNNGNRNYIKGMLSFVHADDRDIWTSEIEKCKLSGHSYSVRIRVLHLNKTIWVEIRGSAVRDTDGKVIGQRGTCQNVTHLVEVERENAFIIEAMRIGIWKFNPKTEQLIWDKSMYSLFGISENNFSGAYDAWEKTLTPESSTKAIHELGQALRGEKEFDTTFKIRTPSGEIRTMGGRGIVIRNDQNEPIQMIGINWDKTKEAQLEDTVIRERAAMAHTAKLASLGEMSAGVAHEINNPLAIISGSVQLLTKCVSDPEKFSSKIIAINQGIERISKIVNGLKKFSRTTDQKNYVNQALSKVLKESAMLIEAISNRYGVPVTFDVRTHSLAFFDEVEIEQVVVNLISNAVFAVKDLSEKWVHVSLFEEEDFVVIQVIDAGTGVEEKLRDKIFEPFFTTKKVGEGTGLGLSICRGIIQEHGGDIQVLTNSRNTTFEVRLDKVILAKSA